MTDQTADQVSDRRLGAVFFRGWLTATAAAVEREADRLTELDSAIGDADHGSNLQRGFRAVIAVLEKEAPASPGAVLTLAGRQLISTVGGAAGPLYGTLLRRAGKALGDAAEVTPAELTGALRTGVAAVAQLGGAKAGDKTMLDALEPAVEALGTSFAAAARAARDGAAATVPLQARKGRASYLGERSIGHQDPGATSSALLITALAETAEAAEATRSAGPTGAAEAAEATRSAGPTGAPGATA
ncbi:dihydroxyacetone kinase subunit DhaL [Streptomyces sp. NPDC087658]|uniref:dihydroxyacetone kinase subunit DhaL n=1 Tax=Streptomyces sp. NPDC087658 TaxID=3365800 RepID=UPI003804C467